MILGFDNRFLAAVRSGEKRHTIRAGERWSEGMRADLYARARQQGMTLLFRAAVTRVEPIELTFLYCEPHLAIRVRGRKLRPSGARTLARADGFPGGLFEMAQYLARSNREAVFEGQLVHWDFPGRVFE